MYLTLCIFVYLVYPLVCRALDQAFGLEGVGSCGGEGDAEEDRFEMLEVRARVGVVCVTRGSRERLAKPPPSLPLTTTADGFAVRDTSFRRVFRNEHLKALEVAANRMSRIALFCSCRGFAAAARPNRTVPSSWCACDVLRLLSQSVFLFLGFVLRTTIVGRLPLEWPH